MLRQALRSHSWPQHLLVALQLAGIALACYPVGWINRGSNWALLLCALGTAAGLWTLWHNPVGNFSIYPKPRERARLITSGPYARVRHPMYTSLMLMMLGVSLFNWHWLNGVGFGLVILALNGKARLEEQLMALRFADYWRYAGALPRFVPGLKARLPESSG